MNRRKFLKISLGSAGALAAITGFYAWQVEPFWLEFVRQDMPIRNLPDALVGKTLMQISDLHIGDRFSRTYLKESLQKAQKFSPDFVVYTGDFVSYASPAQFGQMEDVMQHAVMGKIATWGVLGNHDYGKAWRMPEVAQKITEICQSVGIHILRNEEVVAEGLHCIGIDDYWGTNYAPQKAMTSLQHDKATIALCHNPDVADEPIWSGYQGWILAGHTHGGQVKPPFLPPPMLPVRNKRYSAGKIELEDGRTLYINRALGHLWQVRFNVRPEITIFTFQKA
jgi:hypothetical protein